MPLETESSLHFSHRHLIKAKTHLSENTCNSEHASEVLVNLDPSEYSNLARVNGVHPHIRCTVV